MSLTYRAAVEIAGRIWGTNITNITRLQDGSRTIIDTKDGNHHVLDGDGNPMCRTGDKGHEECKRS